jgi:hypothetical protein
MPARQAAHASRPAGPDSCQSRLRYVPASSLTPLTAGTLYGERWMSTEAPSTAAAEQITATALDYIEGWFDGDAERMRQALHPDLAKRSLETDGPEAEQIKTLTAEQMIGWTGEGMGRAEDPSDRRIEVTINRVDDRIATATCLCALYVDYLQLAKTSEGWKIVNVLWAPR